MSFEGTGFSGLNYDLCGYDGSRLQFRGPKCDLSQPYVAFLGTTETYGKFVQQPFSELLSARLRMGAVNLGLLNCGVDALLGDPATLKIAKGADLRIVQILGALNLGNTYFKVHPRRNDRFIAPTLNLEHLFPEIDFTEFHFTKAMLRALRRCSSERFEIVCSELQNVWLARMTFLLKQLGGKTILLWFSPAPPRQNATSSLGEPMLIDEDMIVRLRRKVSGYAEVIPSQSVVQRDYGELMHRFAITPATGHLMGQHAHKYAASTLEPISRQVLKGE